MFKFSLRYNKIIVRKISWSVARTKPRITDRNMATEPIVAAIRAIMQPLSNERNKREAGRIVRRSDLINLADLYKGSDIDIRSNVLSLLAEEFGCNSQQVLRQCGMLVEMNSNRRDESAILSAEAKLGQALRPAYHVLFMQLGTLKDGVKLLIDMRHDALHSIRHQQLSSRQIQSLRCLSDHIGDILSMWFSIGLLQLSQINWNTPASILEKLADYEAVHTVRNWMDLKHRLGPNRRCYAFFHGNMPEEPLIVLHVALTDSISDKVTGILDYKSRDCSDEATVTTAIFYSITSTQKGLQGIELGAYLIQSVVESLRSELPQLTTYSSLSPIPGFRKWLLSELGRGMQVLKYINSDNAASLQKARMLINHEGDDASLVQHVIENLHLLNQNQDLNSCVKETLMKLCAHYICKVKHRSYALDPVANFHLKNGAVVWRLNWIADTTLAGLKNSCGIMVNYRYYLENMANNSINYISNHTVPISNRVSALLHEIQESKL